MLAKEKSLELVTRSRRCQRRVTARGGTRSRTIPHPEFPHTTGRENESDERDVTSRGGKRSEDHTRISIQRRGQRR
ncbi:hypothetical protein BDV18DRAFT_137242 [Aspergillus unguis]